MKSIEKAFLRQCIIIASVERLPQHSLKQLQPGDDQAAITKKTERNISTNAIEAKNKTLAYIKQTQNRKLK